MVALTLFTFLWSNIAVLQTVKVYHFLSHHHKQSLISLDHILFYFLFLAVLYAFIQPYHSRSLILLCCAHILSLTFQGSQSNHVIVAITITSATLLNYSKDRKLWQKQLSGTMLILLMIIYFVPWIHKMNTDWFDPSVSCASLFASGFLSIFMPLPNIVNHQYQDSSDSKNEDWNYMIVTQLLKYAPHQAVFIEAVLPLLLLLWRVSPINLSLPIFKFLFITASSFHLLICLPLPPLSVYPFSMIMVPMYALLLPLSAITYFHQTFLTNISPTKNSYIHINIIMILTVVVTIFVHIIVQQVLGTEEMPLEYPPYGLWKISVIWSIVAWTLITISALSVTTPITVFTSPKTTTSSLIDELKGSIENHKTKNTIGNKHPKQQPKEINTTTNNLRMNENTNAVSKNNKKNTINSLFPRFQYKLSGILLAIVFFIIGLSPYLGIRNYPALAMFSNLRTEGPSSSMNHLFIPSLHSLFKNQLHSVTSTTTLSIDGSGDINGRNIVTGPAVPTSVSLSSFLPLFQPLLQSLPSYQYDTVTIHSTGTTLTALKQYQVNLGLYFAQKTKTFNTAYGVKNEFWITPPTAAWPPIIGMHNSGSSSNSNVDVNINSDVFVVDDDSNNGCSGSNIDNSFSSDDGHSNSGSIACNNQNSNTKSSNNYIGCDKISSSSSSFVEYTIPFIELRKHISNYYHQIYAARNNGSQNSYKNSTTTEIITSAKTHKMISFSVNFTLNQDSHSIVFDFDAVVKMLQLRSYNVNNNNKNHLNECDDENNKDEKCNMNISSSSSSYLPSETTSTDIEYLSLFQELITPLGYFETILYRFRSFDTTYSPCRH